MERWSPGDAVVLREVWRGRVFHARPATVVRDDPDQTMLLVPGSVACGVPIGDDETELRVPDRPWHLEVRERNANPILSFAWPDTPYAILRWSTPDGVHAWYVNLQDPLRRTPFGFDTTDHALDAIVAFGGSWGWKDEDELAEAVADGLFTPEDARRFRADGEHAVERILRGEPPFDRDWTTWGPEPAWRAPALPEGWDRA
jgi:hypothetical protein